MKNANLSFKGQIPFNEEFGDIYFNTEKPWLESEFVFSSALDEIWQSKDSFIVAETGFGAGLNFFTLCKKFKNSPKKLHFVSIEKSPIKKEDLLKIYENLGIFKTYAKKLVSLYPPLISGIHRINFAPNITLDLCYGEADQILPELEFSADIWFLDGFAPSKNGSIWSEDVFKQIARLSRVGTIARTYSCAKMVKVGLKNAGFLLSLKEGYARKRQMSSAVLEKKDENLKDAWFARCEPVASVKGKTALVIGAGVAGLATAGELAKNGFKVVIAEAKGEVATNGSGNHCGALMPLVTKPGVNLGRMHLNAFLQAVRFYKATLPKSLIKFNGCIDYAFDDELIKRYGSWQTQSVEDIFKFDESLKPYPGIFIKDGAYARPREICKFLSGGFEILLNHEYEGRVHLQNGKISVKFKNGKNLETDILVFCTGSKSSEIFKGYDMQISSVRGQVTHLKPVLKNAMPLSAKGYICPAVKGVQVIGATYARNEIHDTPKVEDNAKNLSDVSEFFDTTKAAIIGSRVGYRSYSGDRFPIIGALHDEEFYKQNYKGLFWSKNKDNNPKASYEKNVFVNFAHGSRGLGTAILGANLIADLVLDRPLCIERSLFHELHPARFLIRKLKKGLKF